MADWPNLPDISPAARRRARQDPLIPTTEDNLAIAAENREHDRKALEAGLRAKPIDTWQEVADFVDEGTWQRILSELDPDTRAECERIRPPDHLLATRQAEALSRLGRAHRRSPR